MSLKNIFLDFVKNGGKPICSPQIGAGAGFDTKLAGREWVSQTTLEDTIAAVGKFDIVPLINIPLCDIGEFNDRLLWRQTDKEHKGEQVKTEYLLETSAGTLNKCVIETAREGCTQTKFPVENLDDLCVLDHYLDIAMESDFQYVTASVKRSVKRIDGKAALSVQWAAQPYEMLGFSNTVDTLMLAFDAPEKFRRLMDKILLLDNKLIEAVASGGADFIFLGAPAAEMISPKYYEDFIIPYSVKVSDMAHSNGLMVYSHICSPIEPFLTMGFYNQMGIDLFETLSPPPVGNVSLLTDALGKIDPAICTRGNLGLDVLLNASAETVREKTTEMLESVKGRKHIIAASDYLFYDIPEKNVHAMSDAVAEYNKQQEM